MTITAKNYASAAASSIAKWLPLLPKQHKADRRAAENMMEGLKESIHFAMPDTGILLDDDLAGIKNMEIRLPYPLISVEYYMPKGTGPGILDERFILEDTCKRVILAREIPLDEVPSGWDLSGLLGEGAHAIFISAIFFSEKNQMWSPCPFGLIIPSKWSAEKGSKPTLGKDYGRPGFKAVPMCLFTDVIGQQLEDTDPQEILDGCMQDISPEVMVVLELLEALSCSNVEESIHQKASKRNAQRIKSHKNPVWETKFLTLVVNPKSGKKGESSDITHASPRQHLRRGHIRRLPSKNIWVNSCVVGSAENGKIEKQYKIRK